jgi:3-phenylpropionate/trans-cinnamate dioxygenase ferredoxin subunit
MPTLPFQIERYIVKRLACDEAPTAIAEDVESKFLREVETEDVWAYCPDRDGTALTPDLRDLYQFTRWKYAEEGEDEREATFVAVATTEEVNDDALYCVEVNGQDILIVARENGYSALANRCTHQGGALCEGDRAENTVTCPLHGAEFDLDTGKPVSPPATEAVTTYEVRVVKDAIEVKM